MRILPSYEDVPATADEVLARVSEMLLDENDWVRGYMAMSDDNVVPSWDSGVTAVCLIGAVRRASRPEYAVGSEGEDVYRETIGSLSQAILRWDRDRGTRRVERRDRADETPLERQERLILSFNDDGACFDDVQVVIDLAKTLTPAPR